MLLPFLVIGYAHAFWLCLFHSFPVVALNANILENVSYQRFLSSNSISMPCAVLFINFPPFFGSFLPRSHITWNIYCKRNVNECRISHYPTSTCEWKRKNDKHVKDICELHNLQFHVFGSTGIKWMENENVWINLDTLYNWWIETMRLLRLLFQRQIFFFNFHSVLCYIYCFRWNDWKIHSSVMCEQCRQYKKHQDGQIHQT